MDTPPSGGRTRTYATDVRKGAEGDTPERSGVSLILSNNGAAGDTPVSSGMSPKRSTSEAAGETPNAVTTRRTNSSQRERWNARRAFAETGVRAEMLGPRNAPKESRVRYVRSGEPVPMVVAGELGMQSKRFERGNPELLSTLSTFKSLQPHAMERAEVHGTSFSSNGMGDAMNAAVRRRGPHIGHRAHAAHKCCARQRACNRARSGGTSRGHDRPGRAKHALTPKRERSKTGHSCGMYHVRGIKLLVHKRGLNWAVDHVASHAQ